LGYLLIRTEKLIEYSYKIILKNLIIYLQNPNSKSPIPKASFIIFALSKIDLWKLF